MNAQSLSARSILTAARDLIADPARFCWQALALDANGKEVGARDPSAVRRCVIGAIYTATPAADYTTGVTSSAERKAIDGAFDALYSAMKAQDEHSFVDLARSGHANVMRAFELAIASLDDGERSAER